MRKKTEIESETPDEEGTRGFAVLLQQVEEGALHAELSDELRDVCRDLHRMAKNYEQKAKGSLTLVLELVADPSGILTVKPSVTKKIPKAKRSGSAFWITGGGNLSVENPRQPRLPIREVPAPAVAAREITPTAQPARTV